MVLVESRRLIGLGIDQQRKDRWWCLEHPQGGICKQGGPEAAPVEPPIDGKPADADGGQRRIAR